MLLNIYTSWKHRGRERTKFLQAILLFLALVQRPFGGVALLSSIKLFYTLEKTTKNTQVMTTLTGLLLFFVTGHQATISSIQWETGFIGYRDILEPLQVALLTLNTLGGPIVAAIYSSLHPKRDRAMGMGYQVAVLTGTAAACQMLLRHLMIWKIFAPRFLLQVMLAAIHPICETIFAVDRNVYGKNG
jgi:phosphatidylinositol glycan class O